MTQNVDFETLSERAQFLFKCLVERYIKDGTPVGSRTLARDAQLELSPATIRNVMSDLEDLGLLAAPHTSAGRVPTVKGYRMFVDSMLTVQELNEDIVQRIASDLKEAEDVGRLLELTSSALSDVTRMAGLVMVPRSEHRALRHVDFLPLSDQRVLVIIVVNNQEVQNRIIHTDRVYTAAELQQAANYLNEAFAGKDLKQVRDRLLREMGEARDEMNRMMAAVIEVSQKGILAEPEDKDGFVISGQTNLMSVGELSDVDKLRQLFESFGRKRDILRLLEQAVDAQGVQIFIGEESGYDALDNCSIVTSTYERDGEVLGVLGVIGPTRMEYERVIPVVDLTARLLGSSLKFLN